MKEILKKHWITFLGTLFMLMAFIYLFKYAADQGWVSNNLKIGLGILAGAGFMLGGITLQQKGREISNQIISGLGAALLYTTFTFAGIYYNIWSPMTVFLSMVAVTLGISIYSFKFNLRILMNAAIIGALLSPALMKSQGDYVFALFLYLLVVNFIFFSVSVLKKWTELRLIAFIGTWILFTTYYLYFNPSTWQTPFKYAVSAFIFYVAGFMVSSWKENLKFNGLNLYLGVINGVLFTLWSLVILDGKISVSAVLAGIGGVYIITAAVIYGLTKQYSIPVLIKFFAGLLFLLIASFEIGEGSLYKPMISVYIWVALAVIILIAGQIKKLDVLKSMAASIWVLTGLYWYAVTWNTPLGIWFGKFIPILNWSGMAWVVLAALGFYLSINVKFESFKKYKLDYLEDITSNFFSIASHLMVGGLLTFQIDNIWEEYKIQGFDFWLALSVTWGVYALLLFMWGAYSKQSIFRWFGSVAVVIVAIKTIFLDLSEADMIYKIMVLFILGILTFAISFINNRWKGKEEVIKPQTVQEERISTPNTCDDTYPN